MMTDDKPKRQHPPQYDDLFKSLQKSRRWGNIQRMAETDEGMKDLINRVVEYYYLKGGK